MLIYGRTKINTIWKKKSKQFFLHVLLAFNFKV